MGMLIDGVHVCTLIEAKDTLLLFLMYIHLMHVNGPGYEYQKIMIHATLCGILFDCSYVVVGSRFCGQSIPKN